MRALRVLAHVSLDGVIQHSRDDDDFPYGEWTMPYRSPEGLSAVLAAQGERFDLLLGRRTYDIWSTYWPVAPASPMADRLNAATKHVVTHRPESLAWGPFEAVGGDIVAEVRGLKAREGPDLVTWGSSTFTSTLLAHDLVDEVVLVLYPVMLGAGKRFFAEGTPGRAFTLAGTRAMAAGTILAHYRAAGAVRRV